jgi:hypothetical protein
MESSNQLATSIGLLAGIRNSQVKMLPAKLSVALLVDG